MLFSLQKVSVSILFKQSIGLIILPLTAGIPLSPAGPAPLDKFKITVSTLSDNVCAVAILVAPTFLATYSKKLYLSSLPASSVLTFFCFDIFNHCKH